MTLRKKKVLALTDGRAGHRSKTQGVLNALAQLAPIKVIWLEVSAPHAILRRLSRWLTRRTGFSSLGWYLTPSALPNHIDLVVSSGADTLVPNLLLSRHYACPNIINSSLKGFTADQFTVALQLGQVLADLTPTVPPNQMSFDHDGQRRRAARHRLGLCPDRRVLTLLIGENTREYQSVNPQLLAEIVAWFRRHTDAVLLLSSSRRAQLATEQALIQVLSLRTDDQVTWVQQGQSCHIADYIYAADWVLCTADSESMLAEVVSAGRLALVPEYAGQGLTAQNQWLAQLTAQGHLLWLN
ncbi:MAG: ELM1/GtrOC1 family putative glycosyltransferase, partial [Moraxellaceae bacterium]